MARKKKVKEISFKDMDVAELERELDKNRQELYKLRFRAVSAPIKNVRQIGAVRRDVARILTFINQKRRQVA